MKTRSPRRDSAVKEREGKQVSEKRRSLATSVNKKNPFMSLYGRDCYNEFRQSVSVEQKPQSPRRDSAETETSTRLAHDLNIIEHKSPHAGSLAKTCASRWLLQFLHKTSLVIKILNSPPISWLIKSEIKANR